MFNNLFETISLDDNQTKIFTQIDPLTVSVTYHRLRTAKSSTIPYIDHFDNNLLYARVNPSDYLTAANIRSYYQKKLVFWKLKGIELTRFRTDLEKYLVRTDNYYYSSELGLLTKLPEFYYYDLQLEAFHEQHYCEATSFDIKNTDDEYIFLKKFERNIRYRKSAIYWFKRTDGALVSYGVALPNTLASAFDSVVSTSKSLIFTGQFDFYNTPVPHYQLSKLATLQPIFDNKSVQ